MLSLGLDRNAALLTKESGDEICEANPKGKLRAAITALDDRMMEVHALARMHHRLGLPVEPWMKLPRLTRRKVAPLVERLNKEML